LALIFPAGAIILALPWGFPETRVRGELPAVLRAGFYAIPEVVLLGIGVTIRKLTRWAATKVS
jgi:hypothetical protein